MQHVNDLSRWGRRFESKASALERQLKQGIYEAERECESANESALQRLMGDGAFDAFKVSKKRWDESGRHTRVVP